MTKVYTVDEILSMDEDTARLAYQTLRTEVEQDYQGVGPRAVQKHVDKIGRMVKMASIAYESADFERKCFDYHHATHIKTLLAIWTGRYDYFLAKLASPCSSGDATKQGHYDRLFTARRARLGITLEASTLIQP